VLLGIIALVSAAPLAYYDLSQMATNGATLAIAAAGQTLVIISGGFELSAGAVVSLVTRPRPLHAGGGAAGAGVDRGRRRHRLPLRRLQRPVHCAFAAAADRGTLSTMFILQGLTLLVLDKPAAPSTPPLDLFIGDAVPNLLPLRCC